MISIVRKGPKLLLFETDKKQELKEYLCTRFSARESRFNDAFEKTEEGYTIVFFTDKSSKSIKNIGSISDSILVVRSDTDPILAGIINDGRCDLVKSLKSGPKIIIMRVFGNVEKVVDLIQDEYDATRSKLCELLVDFEKTEPAVVFTKQPLNEKVTFEDLFKYGLSIDENYFTLYKRFRIDALKYINEGLEKRDWYEMEIRIYDRYRAYEFHYQKLLNVLENLELGLILGEAWAKDYPRLFMAVGVYRLRFFSFYEPKYIKKILMGLEYSKEGKRIVDYDLYYKRRHIHWSDVIEDNIRVRDRLGLKFREDVFSSLKPFAKNKVDELDAKILQTRVDDM